MEDIVILLEYKNDMDINREVSNSLYNYYTHSKIEEITDSEFLTKDFLFEEYESKKDEYRKMNKKTLASRMLKEGCKSVDEYINKIFEFFEWDTLGKYAFSKYDIVRFEGNSSVYLGNPNGFIELYVVDSVYKKDEIDKLYDSEISFVVGKDKSIEQLSGKKISSSIYCRDLSLEDYMVLVSIKRC